MLELLKKVLKPVAPSGLEEPVAAVIREEVAPYVDSIETDALGNLICVKNGTEANPEKIMLSAHMDHIGYIVTARNHEEASAQLAGEVLGGFEYSEAEIVRIPEDRFQ